MVKLTALSIAVLFGATLPIVGHAQKLRFGTDGLVGSASVAEMRIGPSGVAALEQEVRSTDSSMVQAIAANDGPAAGRLLDSDFIWIDRDGRGRTKSDLVNR